jgi:outer membrane biosynthesis protein TonB
LLFTGAWAVSAFPIAAGQSEGDSSQQPPATKVTSEPKVLHKVDAVYPPAAKNEGVEGTFRIDVLIDTGGRIKEARVVASAPTLERLKEMENQKGTAPALEGDARLAAAAVDAVKQWRYEPIRDASGKAVEAKMTLTVRFVL